MGSTQSLVDTKKQQRPAIKHGPHVMAFGVTNLGLVLVPYPPNSEKGQNMILEGMILCGAILPRLWRPFEPLHGAAANALARCKSGLSMPA